MTVKFGAKTFALAFPLILADAGSAAVILSSDFSGTSKSGTTMSNITWTTEGILSPATSVTVDNTIQANGTGDLFTTADSVGVIAPANNTSNGGEWNITVDLTTQGSSINLENFQLTYLHFSGSGTSQNAIRDANYTFEIRDSLGVALAGTSSTINTPNINTSIAGPQTISFDLSGVTLAADTDYTLFIQAADADGPNGNNTGFDAITLNGTIVPEPSSALLTGLAASFFLLRRRRG